MLLYLKAIDEHQEERKFSCFLHELEFIFEFLNNVVAKGHTLIYADLIDDEQSMSLPVAAFDGVSFLSDLKQLEREWTSILAKPLQSGSPSTLVNTRWYREKISFYEQSITSLELMITDVSRLYQRAEEVLESSSKSGNNPYQSVLNRYESQLKQAHRIRLEMLEHI